MRRATKQDRSAVVQILSRSFQDNKSVNYILPLDSKRLVRIASLMEYSFLTCLDFGEVFLTENGRCCALVLFPDRKKTSLRSIWRDVSLILSVTGIAGAFKVLRRESLIHKRYPSGGMLYYVWFVGCDVEFQGMGGGTQMMEFLLSEAERMKRPVYLETSVEKNVPWYQRFGLRVYDQLDLGYILYFLKN